MPNVYSTLSGLFTAIANSIRSKTGSSAQIVADDFPTEIGNIIVATPEDYGEYADLLTEEYGASRKLDTPVLIGDLPRYGSNNVKTITWEPVNNATSYDVYKNGTFVFNYVISPSENASIWKFNEDVTDAGLSDNYRPGGEVFYSQDNGSTWINHPTSHIYKSGSYSNFITFSTSNSVTDPYLYYYPQYKWYFRYGNEQRNLMPPPFYIKTVLGSGLLPMEWVQANAEQYAQAGYSDNSFTLKVIAKADGYADSDPAEITISD